jgi:tetratricopeptide (TPR) repeat protein
LVEIVEMKRFNKAAFGFGYAHDRSIMLAELYELQKDYPAAQKYYREASEKTPSNIRNLGAYAEFLARHGDKKEAGKLFEQFEAITYSIEQPKHLEVITVVADARLKAIMDRSADKSYMSDPHFQWVPAVQKSYVKISNFCKDRESSASFARLLAPR